MNIEFFELLILLCVGVGSGLVGSMLGLGGGIFIIPILTIYFEIPMLNAISISLLLIVLNSNLVSLYSIQRKTVCLPFTTCLEPIVVLCGALGAYLATQIQADILTSIFGFFALFIAIVMVTSKESLHTRRQSFDNPQVEKEGSSLFDGVGVKFWQGFYFDETVKSNVWYQVRRPGYLFPIFCLGGVFSGLLGVGGGVIYVPCLHIIAKLPLKVATGTSMYLMGMSVCGGALILLLTGYVDLYLAICLAIGVQLGSVLSKRLMNIVNSKVLKICFAIVVSILGVKMICL